MRSTMQGVLEGNALFVEENYEAACQQYSKALKVLMDAAKFPALFGRGRAFMYLQNYSNAIKDFGNCLSLDHQHQLANYYYGMSYMKSGKKDLDRMKKAHKYLLIAQKGHLKQPRFQKAVDKAIKFINKLQPKVVIKPPVNDQPINNNDNDVDIKQNNDQNQSNPNTNPNPNPSVPPASKPTQPAQPKQPTIRDSWYQSATKITFTLYAKNLNKNDVSIEYESNRVTINLKLANGTLYNRNLLLTGLIIASQCSYTMNKYKVIITLTKKTVGQWDKLEDKLDDGKKKYPWQTKKNWNDVSKYAAAELEKDKPEGDEALQSLFSKIYKDADDDQRRAMVKSFQTSGGTVLSTNWKDVKDKDYEGKDKVLPTGQTPQKYEY